MQKIIGIGVDICKIERINKILLKSYSTRFLTKALHENELKFSNTPEFVSSRWAAKEALVKSIGIKSLIFSQIEVTHNTQGQPQFLFHSACKEILKYNSFFLTISHENEYSIAVVLAFSP